MIEIALIGVGLSMDAFAVSIMLGLSDQDAKPHHRFIPAAFFGAFQGIMPLIGFFVGSSFAAFIFEIDHWITFGILAIIGIKMIKDSFSSKEEEALSMRDIKKMLLFALATSIDALAVGVAFGLQSVNIALASSLIAAITFVCSLVGLSIGDKFGSKLKSRASILGGAILVAIGIKVLVEHLFFGG